MTGVRAAISATFGIWTWSPEPPASPPSPQPPACGLHLQVLWDELTTAGMPSASYDLGAYKLLAICSNRAIEYRMVHLAHRATWFQVAGVRAAISGCAIWHLGPPASQPPASGLHLSWS
jgi:hypothetical protein